MRMMQSPNMTGNGMAILSWFLEWRRLMTQHKGGGPTSHCRTNCLPPLILSRMHFLSLICVSSTVTICSIVNKFCCREDRPVSYGKILNNEKNIILVVSQNIFDATKTSIAWIWALVFHFQVIKQPYLSDPFRFLAVYKERKAMH